VSSAQFNAHSVRRCRLQKGQTLYEYNNSYLPPVHEAGWCEVNALDLSSEDGCFESLQGHRFPQFRCSHFHQSLQESFGVVPRITVKVALYTLDTHSIVN
jgi:hypothetical protein